MVEEARLEHNESGLAPVTEGWFVVNVRDAAWIDHDVFGANCIFESPEATFTELGIGLCVLQPGQPNGLYHAEETQEDFLVLAGECLLLVEGEERRLGAWDFVHSPPGTEHIFVGSGEGPCVILMTGTRRPGRPILYPVSKLALSHRAGVETETPSPKEAYASYPEERVERSGMSSPGARGLPALPGDATQSGGGQGGGSHLSRLRGLKESSLIKPSAGVSRRTGICRT